MKDIFKIFKNRREQLGLTVEEVSSKTGIRPDIIHSIEAGEFPEMPSVYIRSFIKKYAQCLKIDNEQYQELLDELTRKSNLERQSQKPITNDSGKGIDPSDNDLFKVLKSGKFSDILADKRFVSSLMYVALSLIIITIVYLIFFKGDTPLEEQENGSSAKRESVEKGKDKGLFDYFEEESDSLVLEAFAVDTTWMSINMDGKRKEELLLRPGNKKVWKAAEYFRLTLGNAGGVKLKRNGTTLESLGARGSVVNNVKITETSVEK